MFPNITELLALANDGGLLAVDQNFRGEGASVVVGSHGGTVSPGAHECQIVSLACFGQKSILAKEIAGFADRTYYIRLDESAAFACERDYLMVGFVKCRADQIIHRGIHD